MMTSSISVAFALTVINGWFSLAEAVTGASFSATAGGFDGLGGFTFVSNAATAS